jgi:hypothetical protein
LKKPDICDTITSAKETLYDRSKDILKTTEFSENILTDMEQKERELYIYKKAEEIRKQQLAEKQHEQLKMESRAKFSKLATEVNNKIKQNHKKIDDYIASFLAIYGRKPIMDEIKNNFKDEIEPDMLSKYLATYNIEDADNNV